MDRAAARRRRVVVGSAAGAIAVVLAWSWEVDWTPGLVWELVAVCVVLAAAFHLFFELDVRAARPSSVSILVAETGFLVVLMLNAFSSLDSPWPWIVGFALLGAMLVRLSISPERSFAPLIAAAGVAAGMSGWYLIAANCSDSRRRDLFWRGALARIRVPVAGIVARERTGATLDDLAAALYPTVVLTGLLFGAHKPALDAPVFLAVSMLLGLLLVLAVTRLESGGGYLGGMILLAVVNTAWCVSDMDLPLTPAGASTRCCG